MPHSLNSVMDVYISGIKKIYGSHLKDVILYGSYARGDHNEESDIDNDIDIKPIAKNIDHFEKWVMNYPFYVNVSREGISLYEAK